MKRYFYIFLIIFMFITCVVGATYAYFSRLTESGNDIGVSSYNSSVSMNINPVYNDFSLIPMDNEDIFKAINNKCKDKEDRGACNLYNININGYDESIEYISGTINTKLDNIVNLSYMVFEEVDYDITNNDNCLEVDDIKYCVGKEATLITSEEVMSLGNNYDLRGYDNKNLLLAIWLSNLDTNQNSFDIGNYTSEVTIFFGDEITRVSGSISSTLKDNYSLQGGE